MIKDYRIYQFDRKEKIRSLLEGLLLDGGITFLFFDSLWAMIPGLVVIIFYFKEKKRKLMRARLKVLRMDFKEFLNALIAALQTGRSIENAFIEALKDIAHSMEKETPFVLEMKRICSGINVGEPLEKLILDFANRSHMEELEYFAEVFSVGKRSGGNLVGMMKHTIRMIQEQMDAEEEIYTVIAEKQMEFQVMCMIPFAMILYLRISAGNLLDNLYGNAIGVLIMTLCLAVYGGCYLYGKRILEIKT